MMQSLFMDNPEVTKDNHSNHHLFTKKREGDSHRKRYKTVFLKLGEPIPSSSKKVNAR